MDLDLEPHHRDLKETLRRFFTSEAPPEVIRELDATGTYPAEILARCAEIGLWGAGVPEEYGGTDLDEVSRCIITEEMQRAGACLSYAYMPTALFCGPALAEHGTDEQKAQLLPALAAGKLTIGMGLSEPEAGSDLMALQTRATQDGDTWVVRGQKVFTTAADTSQYILTLVRTDPNASRGRGLSVLLVPSDADGVQIAPLHKLSGQATHTCEVFLDDVHVPLDALVGSLGDGSRIMLGQLDADRLYTAGQSLGTAQGAFDLALSHARERRQFGRPIIEHQAIGHMLANMQMRIEAARLMMYRAALIVDRGERATAEAAAAKIMASEAATSCAVDGMQILGGYSYMVESGMERYYREAKIQEIFAGTNQILRNVIVRELQR